MNMWITQPPVWMPMTINSVDENDQIRQDFKAAHNLKAGAEVRIESLYLRAGTQYLMSPFTDARNNAEQWIYGGGLGFRTTGALFRSELFPCQQVGCIRHVCF